MQGKVCDFQKFGNVRHRKGRKKSWILQIVKKRNGMPRGGDRKGRPHHVEKIKTLKRHSRAGACSRQRFCPQRTKSLCRQAIICGMDRPAPALHCNTQSIRGYKILQHVLRAAKRKKSLRAGAARKDTGIWRDHTFIFISISMTLLRWVKRKPSRAATMM